MNCTTAKRRREKSWVCVDPWKFLKLSSSLGGNKWVHKMFGSAQKSWSKQLYTENLTRNYCCVKNLWSNFCCWMPSNLFMSINKQRFTGNDEKWKMKGKYLWSKAKFGEREMHSMINMIKSDVKKTSEVILDKDKLFLLAVKRRTCLFYMSFGRLEDSIESDQFNERRNAVLGSNDDKGRGQIRVENSRIS